jgi:hypothetical protein
LLAVLLWGAPALAEEADKPAEGAPAAEKSSPAAAPTQAPAGAEGAPPASPLNPEANEFPAGAPAAMPADFDRLLADIAALRSRVAALMTSLFTSKLMVNVESVADDARVVSVVVTLDGGVIYSSTSFAGDESKKVYEQSVAPGHHVLGIQVERVDARSKEYRNWEQARFSIVVPEKKRLEASFVVEDESDMGESFPDSEAGEYSLEVELFARVVE